MSKNKLVKSRGKLVGRFFVTKFASKKDYENGKELEARKFIGKNLLLNEGINELFTLIGSSSGTKFDNANANLGVGDSATAASAGQVGLQAAVNKLYKGMEAGYPTYGTSQKITFRSLFGASEANFAWNEFTVANGNSDSAKNLNRLVEVEGTKTSGQVWQLDLEVSLS